MSRGLCIAFVIHSSPDPFQMDIIPISNIHLPKRIQGAGRSSGSFLQANWISQYLSRSPSQMVEIRPPSLFYQDIWTCKVSASYPFYIQNCITVR